MSQIRRAATRLTAGDTFVVTYAGHGSQVRDTAGEGSESEGLDETWCAFDRMIAAVFIAGALRLLRELDQGRGVYISMSWFAAGAFVPTTV